MEKEKEVLKLLRNKISASEIHARLGINYYKLKELLKVLEREGKLSVERIGKKFTYYKFVEGVKGGN